MPRGIYNRKTRSASQKTQADNLITVKTDFKGWEALSLKEQETAVIEGNKTAVALAKEGSSRIEVGEHLANLQAILEPHNVFQKFVRANFRFTVRTAYRRITGYKNAKAHLPAVVLKAAMQRGYNIIGDTDEKPLGVYTEAVAKLPVPSTPDLVQANTWLDQIEDVRKKGRSEASVGGSNLSIIGLSQINRDPNTMLKECYRFVMARFKDLPINHKTRANWMRSLIGMEMTMLGVGSQQTFAPVAPPEEFRTQRGRPKEAAAA